MSERLHYFTEATTPVAFDCDDSEIDSDLDESRRPVSEADRAKFHARQLQLWSDEARRRRSAQPPPAPSVSPRRRPSSASMHDVPVNSIGPAQLPLSQKLAPQEVRGRVSTDRQQSNLSERARHGPNSRVSRSPSAKNLRIRITPSSSSKSLVSDIESELGQSQSAPQSPKFPPAQDSKALTAETPLQPIFHPDRREPHALEAPNKNQVSNDASTKHTQASASARYSNTSNDETADNNAALPTGRMSFSRRVMRFSSLKKLLRRQ